MTEEYKCDDCGKFCAKHHLYKYDDDRVCRECFNEIIDRQDEDDFDSVMERR